MTVFTADANPDWPGKGQRKFCVIRSEGPFTEGVKLPTQFNTMKAAQKFAYERQVKWERSNNRSIYLGD